MLASVFSFWISIISRCTTWLFTLKINENPDISVGSFILGFASIGLILYFILGSDFFPNIIHNTSSRSSNSNSNYNPRHAPGNGGKDFSTRESRHKY